MLERYLVDPFDFEVEDDFIGEGNYGTVSLVHPKKDVNNKVALKKIPIDLEDKDFQKSIIREVTVMASLQHPNILELVGFSLNSYNDKTFRIYSKYLPNGTLEEALKADEMVPTKERRLNATQRSKIVYGIASAMAHLHKNNIVHRDLKPENIFLDQNFEPVLSDFGFSRFANENEMNMTSRLGTPFFMAPELMIEEDENKISNKIDVYAFAVTILSMFTTDYKFEGRQPRTINQLIERVANGRRYKIPKNVPKYYVSLIERCWSTEAKLRPSFEEIVEEMEKNYEFIFEGSDVEEVKRYIKYIKDYETTKSIYKNNKLFSSSSTSSDNDEENDDEYIETEEFNFGSY